MNHIYTFLGVIVNTHLLTHEIEDNSSPTCYILPSYCYICHPPFDLDEREDYKFINFWTWISDCGAIAYSWQSQIIFDQLVYSIIVAEEQQRRLIADLLDSILYNLQLNPGERQYLRTAVIEVLQETDRFTNTPTTVSLANTISEIDPEDYIDHIIIQQEDSEDNTSEDLNLDLLFPDNMVQQADFQNLTAALQQLITAIPQ